MSEKHSSSTSFVPQERIQRCKATSTVCPICERMFWHRAIEPRKCCSKECQFALLAKNHKIIHGGTSHKTKTKLYGVWTMMKRRCNSPACHLYPRYGAKGIKVCMEWSESFAEFRRWALNSGYMEGLSIDRKNGNGNYCPENCRWATQSQQLANARRTRKHSPYRGVNITPSGKWVARIAINKVSRHIGTFVTAVEAAKAYDIKAKELHKEFATLNFPDKTT